VSPSHTTKQCKLIRIFGVKELHDSVTLDHLQTLGISDLKQVVLCILYKYGYKHINVLLKVSVL
jgi:hypothetical protein